MIGLSPAAVLGDVEFARFRDLSRLKEPTFIKPAEPRCCPDEMAETAIIADRPAISVGYLVPVLAGSAASSTRAAGPDFRD